MWSAHRWGGFIVGITEILVGERQNEQSEEVVCEKSGREGCVLQSRGQSEVGL